MEIQEILQRVDELKAEIDALRPISPEQEQRIMQKFRLDWTFHSNAIEGNSLTYGETRALLLYGVTAKGKPLKDALDIKGHHEALDYLVAFVQQKQELTEAHIREIHKIILSEPYEMEARTPDGRSTKRRIAVGQYKSMPNHVITQTGETHYYATPEETPARMSDLMAWYRRERDKLHSLILAATFHYEFVAIHPFDDGNGRMARLLMNLILMQAGYPPVVVRIDGRSEYYLALAQADAGELDNFITLIGNLLIHSLGLFLRGAKGESIEELNDLDKKLALLERQLETSESSDIIDNKENRINLFDSLISPFLNLLFSQLTKFHRFFYRYDYQGLYGNKSRMKPFYGNPQSIITQLKEYMTNDLEITDGQISFWLEELKNNTNYSVGLVITLRLSNREFDISYSLESPSNKQNKLLVTHDSNFGRNYANEELEEMILPVVNAMFNLIEEEVSKNS